MKRLSEEEFFKNDPKVVDLLSEYNSWYEKLPERELCGRGDIFHLNFHDHFDAFEDVISCLQLLCDKKLHLREVREQHKEYLEWRCKAKSKIDYNERTKLRNLERIKHGLRLLKLKPHSFKSPVDKSVLEKANYCVETLNKNVYIYTSVLNYLRYLQDKDQDSWRGKIWKRNIRYIKKDRDAFPMMIFQGHMGRLPIGEVDMAACSGKRLPGLAKAIYINSLPQPEGVLFLPPYLAILNLRCAKRPGQDPQHYYDFGINYGMLMATLELNQDKRKCCNFLLFPIGIAFPDGSVAEILVEVDMVNWKVNYVPGYLACEDRFRWVAQIVAHGLNHCSVSLLPFFKAGKQISAIANHEHQSFLTVFWMEEISKCKSPYTGLESFQKNLFEELDRDGKTIPNVGFVRLQEIVFANYRRHVLKGILPFTGIGFKLVGEQNPKLRKLPFNGISFYTLLWTKRKFGSWLRNEIHRGGMFYTLAIKKHIQENQFTLVVANGYIEDEMLRDAYLDADFEKAEIEMLYKPDTYI